MERLACSAASTSRRMHARKPSGLPASPRGNRPPWAILIHAARSPATPAASGPYALSSYRIRAWKFPTRTRPSTWCSCRCWSTVHTTATAAFPDVQLRSSAAHIYSPILPLRLAPLPTATAVSTEVTVPADVVYIHDRPVPYNDRGRPLWSTRFARLVVCAIPLRRHTSDFK